MTESITPSKNQPAGTRRALESVKSAVAAVRRPAAAMYRRVRDSLDRQLHLGRRSRAIARLRAAKPKHVLMICLGNICRSPYAEFALKRALTGTDIEIGSAGFIGPGRSSPERALDAAAALGIDLGPHQSKLVTTKMLRDHELIVVMETGQRSWLLVEHRVKHDRILVLGDLDPGPIETRTILDPYAGSAEEFARCYARIQRCIDVLGAVLDGSYRDV